MNNESDDMLDLESFKEEFVDLLSRYPYINLLTEGDLLYAYNDRRKEVFLPKTQNHLIAMRVANLV